MPSSLRPCMAPDASPTSLQQYWLTRSGSLTEALRQLGEFSLTRVHEGQVTAGPDDAALLGVEEGLALWARDVLLHVDDMPLVYAHSLALLDDTVPNAEWAGLRHQGQYPLATLLYQDNNILRRPFTWRWVHLPSAYGMEHLGMACSSEERNDDVDSILWARHSCFLKRQRPLVVAEVFLPAFWKHPRLAVVR